MGHFWYLWRLYAQLSLWALAPALWCIILECKLEMNYVACCFKKKSPNLWTSNRASPNVWNKGNGALAPNGVEKHLRYVKEWLVR